MEDLSLHQYWNKEGMHHRLNTWPRDSPLSEETGAKPPASCRKLVKSSLSLPPPSHFSQKPGPKISGTFSCWFSLRVTGRYLQTPVLLRTPGGRSAEWLTLPWDLLHTFKNPSPFSLLLRSAWTQLADCSVPPGTKALNWTFLASSPFLATSATFKSW